MRRKLLLTVALAVLGTAVTAAVVNGQVQEPPGNGGGVQDEEPPPNLATCSNQKDDDGDGQIDLADPGCSDPYDGDETDPPPPPPPPPGGGGGNGGGGGGPVTPIVIDPSRMNRQDINFSPVDADPAAHAWHGQQRGTFDGSKKVQGKLVITMGGIGGGAHNGGAFQYAAGRGFHMLAVDMYNSEGGESNQGKVYLESWTGQDHTPVANVTAPDGVMSRVKKGLAFLQSQDPGAAWNYYLDAQGEVRWQDVILFGYSYGGQVGLAATKVVAPYRVIITASPTLPDDAAWLTEMPNMADVNKCFAINSAGEASKFVKLTMAGWPGTPQVVMNDSYAMVMQPPFMNSSKIQAPGGHTEFCSVAGDRYDVICDFLFDVKK